MRRYRDAGIHPYYFSLIALISIALTLVIIVDIIILNAFRDYNIAAYAAIGSMCVLASVLFSDAYIKSTIIR